MKTIKIGEKTINLKPIDFNAVCELEDLGFSVSGLKDKTFSSIRALVAFNMNLNILDASDFIQNHLKNGGKISDFSPLITHIAESDFFQSLSK